MSRRGTIGWLILLGTVAVVRAEAPLEVGLAERDITPPLDGATVYLAGFGHNRKADGVQHPLFARAVVLRHGQRKIALVALDLVGLFQHRVEAIRQRLKGFDAVWVACTHTHEGPDTLGLWGANPFSSGVDEKYLARVTQRSVEAIEAADKAVRPVTVEHGTASAPELLHDSRPPIVKHDELTVLRFRDPTTRSVLGLVVVWNCHPETLDSRFTKLSSDYVLPLVQTLTAEHRCPVVYFTGTVGGLMTTMRVELKDAHGRRLPEGSVAKTEEYGKRLAAVANRALKTAQPIRLTPFRVRQRQLFLPVTNKRFQVVTRLKVVDRPVYHWTGQTDRAERIDVTQAGARPLAIRTELALWRLGDLDVAGIPGEIYPELVLDAEPPPAPEGADFPKAAFEPTIYGGLRPRRVLIGLANDEIGYILPKRQWDEKAPFTYGRTSAPYGEINSLGPDTAALLCEAFRQLTQNRDPKD